MSNKDVEFDLSKFQNKYHVVLNGAGLYALVEQMSKGELRDKVTRFITRHRVQNQVAIPIPDKSVPEEPVDVAAVDGLKPESTVAQQQLAKYKADKLKKEQDQIDEEQTAVNKGKSSKNKKKSKKSKK